MKVRVELGSLMEQLDALGQGLADEATRPAAQAGAQVFYDMVKAKAPVSTKEHSTKGKKQTYYPGNLRNAVYQVFSKSKSSPSHVFYDISVNKKKAFYWPFLEFGTKKMAARPFLRPSFYAAEQAAQQAMKARYLEEARKLLGHGT